MLPAEGQICPVKLGKLDRTDLASAEDTQLKRDSHCRLVCECSLVDSGSYLVGPIGLLNHTELVVSTSSQFLDLSRLNLSETSLTHLMTYIV